MEPLTLAIAFLMGIVSFLSPCIIPMIIVYLTTITGFSLDELMETRGSKALRRNLLLRTLAFVASFTLVFSVVGGAAGFAGSLLAQYFSALSLITGALFILFGLHLIGLLRLPLGHSKGLGGLSGKLKRFRGSDGGLSYLGVFIVGFFFALVCSHCIGPTLYSIVALAASTASASDGMALLFAFSIGLGIPFMLTALFFWQAVGYLHLAKRHVRLLSLAIGILLLLFGLVLVTGNYLALTSLFYQIVPWRIPGM